MQLGPLELFIIILLLVVLFAGTERYANWMVKASKSKSEPPRVEEESSVDPALPVRTIEMEAEPSRQDVTTGNIQDATVTIGDRNIVNSTVVQQNSLRALGVSLKVFVSSASSQAGERAAVYRAAEKHGFLDVDLVELVPACKRSADEVRQGLQKADIFLLFGSAQIEEAQLAEQRQACARQNLQRFYFAPRGAGKGTAQALGEPVRVVATYSDLELLPDLIAKHVLEDYFHGRRAGKADPYRLTAPQVALLLGIGVTLGISDHLIAAVRRLLEAQLPAPQLPPAAPPEPAAAQSVREPARLAERKPEQEPDEWETLLPFEPETVPVPAGEFWMGSDEDDAEAWDREKPRHRVWLDAYRIGRFPVTVAQFRVFADQTGYLSTAERDKYSWTWRTPRREGSGLQGKDQHPVTAVSWEDAAAYCRWLTEVTVRSYALPSEAQWERAARGPDGRRYPWGNQPPDRNLCNINSWYGGTTHVGQFSPAGDSPFGCADMAGNVWEWCADWYDSDYYRQSPARNPGGPATGSSRVLRGGSWSGNEWYARCAYRSRVNPVGFSDCIGFRVVVCPSSTLDSDPLTR